MEPAPSWSGSGKTNLSTLYIRLPSKATADSVSDWRSLACPFAVVSNANLSQGSTITRQGTVPFSDLSDTIAKAQRVVAVLAASDVNVLRIKMPPLSAAKLKAALPNLVEDQLIADPSDCVVVAGGVSDGLRTVAVVQRTWLDTLAKTLIACGARRIAAFPAQLCLHFQSGQLGSVTAAIDVVDEAGQDAGIDMTLRLSEQGGIGLAIAHEPDEPAAQAAIRALCTIVPEVPVTLYVPQTAVSAYQEAVNDNVELGKRITVSVDNWTRWIASASGTMLDLMTGLGVGTGSKLDWRPWRWPMALAAVVLFINAAALNVDWWRLNSESKSMRTNMFQIYKSAYPKESVIIDPIAQMQQKIAAARHDSGMVSPDDFTALTAALGAAWSSAEGNNAAIAAIDYRERSLYVRLKPGGESPPEQMKSALSKYGLALDLAPEQSGAVVWQIRSKK
jgi:general secretion pathway protein L